MLTGSFESCEPCQKLNRLVLLHFSEAVFSKATIRFPLDEVICQRKRESNFAIVHTVQNVRKGEGKLAKVFFMVSA
jgi:hypothetical protein